MDAHEASYGLLAKRTRMDFGWGLAKLCWRLVRADRVLLGLAFPTGLFLFGAGLANLALTAPHRSGSPFLLAMLLLGCMLAGMFFQTALAFAADAAIDDDRLGWRDAVEEARWRLGAVFGWAVISVAVAFLIASLGHVYRLGFVASLLGMAWPFATFFVVPMIALDLASPVEALSEVRYLLRDRWGEQLAGSFGIGGVVFVASIPIGILIGIGSSYNHTASGSGTLPLVIAGLLLVVVWVLGVATLQTFAVALFRDATVGYPDPAAFVTRRPKRKSWVVRIATVILVGLLTFGLIFSIAGPRPQPKEFHTGFPARYAVAISAGMPVVYQGQQVGEVKRTEISGVEDIVWFTVDDEHRSLQSSSSVTLSFFAGRPCLAILLPGEAPPGASPESGSASSF